MKITLQDTNRYLLRINNKEEVMSELKKFCQEQNIQAGVFSFIGATNEVELWWYNTPKQEYQKKVFQKQMEITGAIGNVSMLNNEIFVHMHGTFSDENYTTYGGHINKAVVSGACEVYLQKLEGRIERAYDKETGLNLFCTIDEKKTT